MGEQQGDRGSEKKGTRWRRQEARWKRMLESWPHPASLHDAEMRFVAANGPLCKMLEADAEALRGNSLLELSRLRGLKDAPSRGGNHSQSEQEGRLEGRVETASGSCLRWRARPAPRQDGLWVAEWDVQDPDAVSSSPASRWLIEAALQAAGEIVGIVDAQGRPVFVNRALERLLGATLERLREAGSAACFYADLAQRKAILEAVWSQGRWEGEVAARTTAGEIIPFQCTYSRVDNPDGRPAGVICIGWDLRPWKQREQELERLLGELQTVLEVVPAGVVTLDRSGRVIGWNRRAEEIFGWTAAEVLGRPAPFWTEQERQESDRQMEEALQLGRSMAREYRAERKDGSALSIRVAMAAAVLRESAVVAAIQDTSGHVLMKRALAQSLQRYLELFEQLPVGLYEARTDGTLLLANPALRELLGYGSDEIALAAEWREATQWQGESWQAFLTEAERTAPGGSHPLVSKAVETEWRRRDGVMLQVRQHVRLHRDRTGRPCRVAATVEEVTALRRAQRELEAAADLLRLRNEQLDQALRQARQAGEAKTRFLAAMSHEIRTPLNAVSAANELLLAAPLGEDQRRLVEMIEGSVRHLTGLVDDVLDLARMESGLWDLNPGRVRLREILAEAVHPFERRARAKGLDFHCLIDPRLPEEVVADGRRLQQIVSKLVDNAVKYTEAGEVVVEAALSQMLERPALCFTVSDTGPGIADELMARIFEPFVQGDGGPARRSGGAGLGLAVARQLVERMDGNLGMMVRPEGGCRFWFEVPLEPAVVVTKKADTCGIEGADTDVLQDRKIRVLIVEDNAVNRHLAARMLMRAGMEVETVESAEDALRRLSQEPFDVVLMDVHMPGMDGREATRRLRQMGPAASRVPVIALTASVLPEDRIACAEAGMDDFLGKPFRLQELVDTVRRWARWRDGEAA